MMLKMELIYAKLRKWDHFGKIGDLWLDRGEYGTVERSR